MSLVFLLSLCHYHEKLSSDSFFRLLTLVPLYGCGPQRVFSCVSLPILAVSWFVIEQPRALVLILLCYEFEFMRN